MAYTEFYSVSGGDNLSAGSTNTGSTCTYTSNAGDSDGTSVFTPNDGSTPASTVSAGMFGSVYITSGATVAVFIGLVNSVAAGVNGAITFDTTIKSGAFPASSAGAHTITCKIGGAHAQPTGATLFPVSFIKQTLASPNTTMPRLSASGTWSMTAQLSGQGGVRYEGMTSAAGDGGRLVIDGSASAITIWNCSIGCAHVNITFQNNSGNNTGINVGVGACYFKKVRVTNIGGVGLKLNYAATASGSRIVKSEFDNCNTTNTAASGAVVSTAAGNATFERCLFHDNSGNVNTGFQSQANGMAHFSDCVFFNNGFVGAFISGVAITEMVFERSDFYNNVDGIRQTSTVSSVVIAENCGFVKNSGFGVNSAASGAGPTISYIYLNNCGFGTGADANGTNVVAATAAVIVTNENPINYNSPTNPWVSPTTGNFTLSSASRQAIGQGEGDFLELGESMSGTTSFPSIGAAPPFAFPIVAASRGGATGRQLAVGRNQGS